MNNAVQYRMLAGDSMKPLLEKLEADGQPLPNPLLSMAFVGELDGKIVSHAIIHSLPIIEYVHAEEKFGETIKTLVERCQDFILKSGAPRVLAHTDHRAMKRLMERIGFYQSPFIWFEWREGE